MGESNKVALTFESFDYILDSAGVKAFKRNIFGKTSFVTILFVFQHFVKKKFCVTLTLPLQGLTGFQH